jgi:hypothetical protein
MGLGFGFFGDILDTVVDLPGKVAEKAVEAVVRTPEIGINIVKGIAEGVEKGIEKIEESLD